MALTGSVLNLISYKLFLDYIRLRKRLHGVLGETARLLLGYVVAIVVFLQEQKLIGIYCVHLPTRKLYQGLLNLKGCLQLRNFYEMAVL